MLLYPLNLCLQLLECMLFLCVKALVSYSCLQLCLILNNWRVKSSLGLWIAFWCHLWTVKLKIGSTSSLWNLQIQFFLFLMGRTMRRSGLRDLLCIQFAILCTWEKDERIDELLKKNESLEIEKMQALKENECLEAEKRQEEVTVDNMEKQVSERETCVATTAPSLL